MRYALFVAAFVLFAATASPIQAQLRQDVTAEHSQVRLYDSGGTGFSLNKYFSPQHFRMGHSMEFVSGSGFGGGSMGMYTNSMMWQFNQKLAARVDVGVAYTPNQQFAGMSTTGGSNTQVFLKNAEIAYRPKPNMMLHLSVRQSPYGSYMSPYGYGPVGYSPYSHRLGVSTGNELFWKDAPR